MNIFYDHIILIHEIHSEVEMLDVSEKDKKEMVQLIEETVHQRILHSILDHLHKDHHEEFLTRFQAAPQDGALLDFLREKVADIEERIKEAAEEIKYELLKEVRRHTSK